MKCRILLVTGERGSGKTTICREVASRAQAAGYTCGGLLTLPIGDSDQRSVVDLHTGDTRSLTVSSDGLRQGRFLIDPDAFSWGAEALTHAVPCDLLVVDELGPVEIERRQGWVVALDLLRSGQFNLALVVVRPELVHKVQLLLPTSAPTVLTVTSRNRDRLPDLLLRMLEQDI
ncbi:MAG: nucleoside-triphosphatase [Anaerolineae bacterium]|jgi:nucleoside-triphosphatase